MNANFFRTIIAGLTAILGIAMTIFDCTTNSLGATTCAAGWLSPQLLGWVVMGIGFAHLVLKGLQGIVGMVNKTVPVVPAAESGPGTVTASQVSDNTKK